MIPTQLQRIYNYKIAFYICLIDCLMSHPSLCDGDITVWLVIVSASTPIFSQNYSIFLSCVRVLLKRSPICSYIKYSTDNQSNCRKLNREISRDRVTLHCTGCNNYTILAVNMKMPVHNRKYFKTTNTLKIFFSRQSRASVNSDCIKF